VGIFQARNRAATRELDRDKSILREPSSFMSDRTELALRYASVGHRGQVRKATSVPYVQHVIAVAWILDRAGFAEDVVIAGLLHDLVEDTPTTLGDIERRFGPVVAELVGRCSEVKTDANGTRRAWLDRKNDHLAELTDAPPEAHAVMLADKLHNLISIEIDMRAGLTVWTYFNASREQILWYYRAVIERCGTGDARLESLAAQCQEALTRVEQFDS
jgi:(p)ppGpp synthase/HD superfamily hydrolase